MKKPIKNCYAAIGEDFYFIEGNREVRDEKHVRNIMNAMLQGEFIPPIIVDEKTRLVIDGQHRYTAAMNLWKQKIDYPIVVKVKGASCGTHLLLYDGEAKIVVSIR